MRTDQFDYELPESLIAQRPLSERCSSRLLYVPQNTDSLVDAQFTQLIEFLRPDDLLVFNNTRVIPARLFGKKATGGKVELLIERVVSTKEILCLMKASKTPKIGDQVFLDGGAVITLIQRTDDRFHFEFSADYEVLSYLEQHGHMPLPPYIERDDDELDLQRYQTVYAKESGAVAAPTAGLHFDQNILDQLKAKGIRSEFVTLHVGSGTFQPVRAELVEDHVMHAEWVDVPETVCEAIQQTRARGGRVVAVGTTVVRSLEMASVNGSLQPFQGETRLFITPGYQFNCVDVLVTNFHLPCSSLLMLVCAFAGYEKMMSAYEHAVSKEYRFFSYGDAMLIERAVE